MSTLTPGMTRTRSAPQVNPARCHVCKQCQASLVCFGEAFIRSRPDRPPVIDAERCFGCYVCASSCPWEAVVVR